MFKLLRRRRIARDDPRTSSRETTPCPQCGGCGTFLVASTDRNRHTTDEVFEYFRCAACRLVFMDPIPNDLGPFYAGGYSAVPESLEVFLPVVQNERYRLDSLLPFKQSGKLLEIGPWSGYFCFGAHQAGFDVTALEMDQQCVDFMNGKLGIRAIQSNDPAATLAEMQEQFDVIAMWHCLEHLHEPWKVIQNAAERLAPGGLLLIAVPNIDSFEFDVLHAAWRNLDTPRHLYFFPLASLTALCGRLGLSKRFSTTTDELSQRFSAETWTIVVRSYIAVPKVRGLMRLFVNWLANRHEREHDNGPNLTVIFERPATTDRTVR